MTRRVPDTATGTSISIRMRRDEGEYRFRRHQHHLVSQRTFDASSEESTALAMEACCSDDRKNVRQPGHGNTNAPGKPGAFGWWAILRSNQ